MRQHVSTDPQSAHHPLFTRMQGMEFQDLVLFLQHLPTTGWSEKEVSVLLSEAFVMMSHFHHSQAHLENGQ